MLSRAFIAGMGDAFLNMGRALDLSSHVPQRPRATRLMTAPAGQKRQYLEVRKAAIRLRLRRGE